MEGKRIRRIIHVICLILVFLQIIAIIYIDNNRSGSTSGNGANSGFDGLIIGTALLMFNSIICVILFIISLINLLRNKKYGINLLFIDIGVIILTFVFPLIFVGILSSM